MAKKQKKPEEPAGESAPMWIVSFADLVTLMMSFFVVLYAMKKGGSDAEAAVAAAIVSEFDGEPPMDPTNPISRAFYKKKGIELTRQDGASDLHAKGVDGKHQNVEVIRASSQTPTSGGLINFEFGKADLNDDSRAIIAKLEPILRGHNAILLVKGHVSSDEIVNRPDDPYGTSLSIRRANSVVDELTRLGIDRRLLRATSCGDNEPLKTGSYDPDDFRRNRRVEVFATDTFRSDFAPTITVPLEGEKKPAAPEPKKAPAETPKAHSSGHH